MPNLNFSLSEEMNAFVEAQVARDGHASAGEYLVSLIRADQRRRAKRTLEAKLLEALESGPATPMTREDWITLRQEALDGLAAEAIRL